MMRKFGAMASMCAIAASLGVARADDTLPVIAPTYADSKEAPRVVPKIAKGAPNIIWILLDDVGYGASGTFGGLINTPTFDKLAAGGLRYTNFHTAGVCSPTRAALLTGRNHHAVGMGVFPHPFQSAGFPGYSGRMEPKDGTVAEYLRDAGYSTYALGKWHLTPDEEITNLGPFDRWPSGKGFEHSFGFHGAGSDQYKGHWFVDNTHINPDGRHLNEIMVDRSIAYIDTQEKLNPDKPFFLYFAPGATHAPIQVGREWIDKYKGKFDAGWDVARAQILARQKKLGVVPANAQLPARDPHVPAWDSLSDEQKHVYCRFMEAYAGFMEYTDHEIGRLIDHLQQSGLAENTVVFLMIGDNGAAKEAGPNGHIEHKLPNGKTDLKAQLDDMQAHMDQIGTGESYSNYPYGWAQAMDTPFRRWKGDVNSEGGTHNPMVVYWPGHVKKGTRTQYSYVTDLLPTALELAGISQPQAVRGIAQTPLQGASLVASMDDARAPTRHTQQFYFLLGSAAMVKDGWKAEFQYEPDILDQFSPTPVAEKAITAPNAVWQLYDLNADFNERKDLAAQKPDKLKELQDLFMKEAAANQAFPLMNFRDFTERYKAMQASGAKPGGQGD